MPPSVPHLLLLHFHLLAMASLAGIAGWSRAGAIGVNWGTASSHPLPPPKVVELLKSNNVSRVRISDADPDVLRSLSGSGIAVTVGIPDLMLRTLNSSKKAAESWVHDNVTRYFPAGGPRVRIEYISVGDEPFLSSHGDQFYPYVLGAATQIQAALTKANLGGKVKVVVPCSFDAFQSESNLPSGGHFRPDINETMIQLLTFFSQHRSPFFVSISPFLSLHRSKNISFDFSLFKGTARPHNDSHRIYKNSFDLSYDTLVTALYNAGFPQMEIVVAQIGWPTDGAANATSVIAEDFMKGLLAHIHSKTGTPLRPRNPPLEVYILSLLDEDQRNMSAGNFERHWGVFTFDGQAKFYIDLGQGSRKLSNAQNVEYLSSRWCVVNNNENLSNATASVLNACSVADCTAVSPGGSCYNIGWPRNVSYAFNSYYQQHDQKADSCYFGGLGLITTVDPSTDTCRFAVGLRTSHSTILVLSQLLLMSSLSTTISMGFVSHIIL